MELLFWLWFYDSRWFLNINPGMHKSKLILLLPLIYHIYIVIVSLIYFNNSALCSDLLQQLIKIKFVLSLSMIICVIKFIQLIGYSIKEEEDSLKFRAKALYSLIKDQSEALNDRNIRTRCLESFQGVLLLILSIFEVIISIVITKGIRFKQSDWSFCPKDIALVNRSSIFAITFFAPIVLIPLVGFWIKLASLISVYICPQYAKQINMLLDNRKRKTISFKER